MEDTEMSDPNYKEKLQRALDGPQDKPEESGNAKRLREMQEQLLDRTAAYSEDGITLDEYISQQIFNNMDDIIRQSQEALLEGLNTASDVVSRCADEMKQVRTINIRDHRQVLPSEAMRRNQEQMDAYTRRKIQEENERRIQEAFLKGTNH